jgi:hypothetical protein
MKRLDRNIESTTPFVNSDFNDILQEQHRIAYSAYLDGINDKKFPTPPLYRPGSGTLYSSTYSTNRGIILNGIEVDAIPSTTGTDQQKSIQFQLYQFDWTFKIDRDAIIYFDGEYHTPVDDLINTDETVRTFEYKVKNTWGVYFIPVTQSIVDENNNIFQKRSYLKNQLGPTGSGSMGTQSVVIDYRFNVVSIDYYNGFRKFIDGDFIENSLDDFTPPDETDPFGTNIIADLKWGQPYVFFGGGGTSRNLKRLIKLNAAQKDDIFLANDLKKWQVTSPFPVGSGDSFQEGFFYRDFQRLETYASQNTTYFYKFDKGINELKGFGVLSSMSGKFPVGFDRTGSPTPISAGLTVLNYGTPSNYGGTQSLSLTSAQLPTHGHGTTQPLTQMDHAHIFRANLFAWGGGYQTLRIWPNTDDANDYRPMTFLGLALGNMPSQGSYEDENVFLTREVPFSVLEWYLSGNMGTDFDIIRKTQYEISEHKHTIDNAGFNLKHENRPPYIVTLYYYKL